MDPFARPTVTPQRLSPWLGELGRTAGGLVDAFRPRSGLKPATREQIVLAVTEVNVCRYTAWVHGAWRDFLGPDQAEAALPVVLDYARASALAGQPVPTTFLDEVLPPDAVRSVRATVAVAEVSTLVGNTVDGLWERLRLRRPLAPVTTVGELLVAAAAIPLATPLFLAAGAMRLAVRVAPPMPRIVLPSGEANLVVHMLADAVPQYLSNAVVRALVLRLPGPVNIGVRAEDTEATVTLGRDEISLRNGLADDTFIVIDGGLELLLDVATRSLTRELRASLPGLRAAGEHD